MIAKTLIAAAAVASAVAVAAPANAGTHLDVTVGLGGYGGGYPVYDAPYYPVYGGHHIYQPDYAPSYNSWGTSCAEGRDVVRYSGFYKVRPLNCEGRRLTYKARKHGDTFIVKVSRRSGNIVSVVEAY